MRSYDDNNNAGAVCYHCVSMLLWPSDTGWGSHLCGLCDYQRGKGDGETCQSCWFSILYWMISWKKEQRSSSSFTSLNLHCSAKVGQSYTKWKISSFGISSKGMDGWNENGSSSWVDSWPLSSSRMEIGVVWMHEGHLIPLVLYLFLKCVLTVGMTSLEILNLMQICSKFNL